MDSNALHRTVTGVLKGYDQLFNLVLDEVEEQVQGTHR
jgi:U6 snRNA-associated Sm-like protein LSm7